MQQWKTHVPPLSTSLLCLHSRIAGWAGLCPFTLGLLPTLFPSGSPFLPLCPAKCNWLSVCRPRYCSLEAFPDPQKATSYICSPGRVLFIPQAQIRITFCRKLSLPSMFPWHSRYPLSQLSQPCEPPACLHVPLTVLIWYDCHNK